MGLDVGSCTEKAFALDEKLVGESTESKLARVRKVMEEVEANVHVITSLDDVCMDIKYQEMCCILSVIVKLSCYHNESG